MNDGIAGSFTRKLGNVFMRVKRKAYLHETEDNAEHNGESQRELNQLCSLFAAQPTSSPVVPPGEMTL
jgi:hypothetical protein